MLSFVADGFDRDLKELKMIDTRIRGADWNYFNTIFLLFFAVKWPKYSGQVMTQVSFYPFSWDSKWGWKVEFNHIVVFVSA